MTWGERAACRGEPVERFYPEGGNEHTFRKLAPLCGSCPVKAHCLNHALKHETVGYWAGTSPTQRRRMRKKLGISFEPLSAEVTLRAAAQ